MKADVLIAKRLITIFPGIIWLYMLVFIPGFVLAVERPVISNVQIDPVTDSVTIIWDSVSGDIDFYIISERDIGDVFVQRIDTVSKDVHQYTFLLPEKKKKEYTVIASYGGSSSTGSIWHSLMILENTGFDPCLYTASFSWNTYKGWEQSGGVEKYIIFDYYSGAKFAETTSLSTTISGLTPNTDYLFYVVAEKQDGTRSSSYSVGLFTEGDDIPDYLYVSVTVESDQVRIYGKTNESSLVRDYRVERKIAGGFTYTKKITVEGTSFQHRDETAEPSIYSYIYKVHALNQCGATLLSSEDANNIFLEVSKDENRMQLHWSPYKPDDLESYQYDVHRVVGQRQQEMLATGVMEFQFQDDITDIAYVDENVFDANICYYVETIDKKTGFTSRSNLACEAFTPKIAVPNAFTPNGDGVNDVFLPIFDFAPKEYRMVIYNSWGGRVFESSSSDVGWDGTSGGERLGQGSYSYSIYIITFEGHTFHYRGGVSILHP